MTFSPPSPSKTPVLLQCESLVPGYGTGLLPAMDVDIAAHQMWGIVGRNGSGKTTLLRTLLGMMPPVGGGVRRHPSTRLSYVAQRCEVQDHVPARVRDIVADGDDRGWSFWRYRPRAALAARVAEALAEVSAETLSPLPFRALSEGQKQRVLLARALISRPNVVVLDEPTSAMDMVNERGVLELLARMCQSRPMAVLVVGHHVAALAAVATHLMVVDTDDALACCGSRETVARDERVTRLYGSLLARNGDASP